MQKSRFLSHPPTLRVFCWGFPPSPRQMGLRPLWKPRHGMGAGLGIHQVATATTIRFWATWAVSEGQIDRVLRYSHDSKRPLTNTGTMMAMSK